MLRPWITHSNLLMEQKLHQKLRILFIEKQYGIKSGFFHNMERQEMNIILKNLKATKGVTIRQLARVTGASKYIVEKA
ncbi:MAG: hypothetical protein D5S00_00600 [Tindallia sp. MSAO_Bac2]|nr:MAG: hypothetical protein D5S00_00600 [Tindallia sp. MSAO_Bac2]